MVSDEELITRLNQLLGEVDIQTATERQLRQKLEAEFGEDLSGRKPLIREQVQKYVDEHAAPEEDEEGEGDEEENAQEGAAGDGESDGGGDETDGEEAEAAPRKRKRREGSGLGSSLSAEMQAFLGMETCARTQVVKLMWQYIKEHNLQNPKDKRKILLDDKLATIFTTPLTMFTMNKQLSRHVYTNDGGGDEDDEDEDDVPKKPKPRAKPAAKAEGGAKKGRTKGAKSDSGRAVSANNPFVKEIRVSEELGAWLGGKQTISRPELTKHFWDYVRKNELQNPENKKEIICDATLKELFKTERFQGFGFQKFVKPHLLPDS